MEKYSILIADDHPIFRSGLRAVIEADPGFEVVGEASDGEEAIAMLGSKQPGILVLDYNMPKLNGFGVLAKIAELKIDVIPVMLTMHDDEAMFAKAFELGVRGYVLKDSASVDIVNCLHAVAQGQIYTSAAVTTYLYKRAAGKDTPGGVDSLTPTERKILRMVAEEKSSREIADKLCVSIRTVDNHRSNIISKLGVTGNNGLFKFAMKNRAELL